MNCLGAKLAGGEAKPKDFKCWVKSVWKHICSINSVSSFSLHITWCLSTSHKPNALILLNICKLAPHRIKTIEVENQSDAGHDICLITEIAFHKIKEDFLGNGDKSSTSFIEQDASPVNMWQCKQRRLSLFPNEHHQCYHSIYYTFSHSSVHFWEALSFSSGDLQEAMEQSLKQKFLPGCSIQGNDQSGILLLGIKPPSRIGKEKWGGKGQCQALPLWGFYG